MNALIGTKDNIDLPKLKMKIKKSNRIKSKAQKMNKDPAHIHNKLHEKCLKKFSKILMSTMFWFF